MRSRELVLAIALLTCLSYTTTQASAVSEPIIMVERPDGWVENLYEDDNISMSFAMVNLWTYMRVINKTDKVMRFNWPPASFLLPDGTARTLCFMYEKVVGDGFELVPLTDKEKEQVTPPPGGIINKKL